jgi:hypothetical protein
MEHVAVLTMCIAPSHYKPVFKDEFYMRLVLLRDVFVWQAPEQNTIVLCIIPIFFSSHFLITIHIKTFTLFHFSIQILFTLYHIITFSYFQN